MKNKYKTLAISIILLLCNNVFAQHGHSVNRVTVPVIRQQPRISGIVHANANANTNAKIHANSNSVFGTTNTHPGYDKNKTEKKNDEDVQDKDKNKSSKPNKKK